MLNRWLHAPCLYFGFFCGLLKTKTYSQWCYTPKYHLRYTNLFFNLPDVQKIFFHQGASYIWSIMRSGNSGKPRLSNSHRVLPMLLAAAQRDKRQNQGFLLTLGTSEPGELSVVSVLEQTKYWFKQMDKNFWMVSVSMDPLLEICVVVRFSRPQPARVQTSRTTIASNSEDMTKRQWTIDACVIYGFIVSVKQCMP